MGHIRGWDEREGEAPSRARWLPVACVAVYWAAVALLGGFRTDHAAVGILVLVLSYIGAFGRRLLRFLLPLILTGVLYDAQRYWPTFLRGRVHVTEPYAFDKRLFGVQTPDGLLTLNEWWQLHTHPFLDLVTGFCYMVFIPVFVLTAAYFVFVVSRTGTAKRSPEFVRARSPRVMWSLLWLTVMGYITHNVYPTAPPWYAASYGFGLVPAGVAPDAAGALRFDSMLGVDFFSDFYGKSVSVFGAIPSLHVGFALLTLYYAFYFGAARTVSAVFFVGMCFSAVYLNHHYVIDVLWAVPYALVAVLGTNMVSDRFAGEVEA